MLTVDRPRIKTISISGYRAFPPYRPTSFEVKLGDAGKNLLLYGENGSGKTSIFRALRELFTDAAGTMNYEERQNAFAQETDDSIVVELTSGTPSEFRWQVGEVHPKETEGVPFRNFARSCLFLDYRDLLQTNFVHRRGPPELFQLLVQTILKDLPVPSRPLADVYQSMVGSNPYRRTARQIGIAEASAANFSEALANHLPEVVAEGNRILGKLQEGTQFELTPQPVTYIPYLKSFGGQSIPLSVTYNGFAVNEPQHFLNEARLTALALSIYLAAARIIRAGRPGILVLDDVLMGLDLENRMPLLNLLEDEFSDWQVLLLTHDHTWYELAREFTDSSGKWTAKEMHLLENQQGFAPIPEIKEGLSSLDRAAAHLAANDLTAAAVYLRAAFELRLRNTCQKYGIEIPFKKQVKEVKANDLWEGIVARQGKRSELQSREPARNHPDFISQALIQRVNMMRSTILNRLSHTNSPNFTRSEVAIARDIVQDLQIHRFPNPSP
jgi:energy-coupling factor transporter ATP-binding protein EcfA2